MSHRHQIIGRIVRVARESFGVPVRGLAQLAGVSHVDVSNIERGIPGYTVDTLEKVVKALEKKPQGRVESPVVRQEILGTWVEGPEEPELETPGGVVGYGSGRVKI